MAAPILSWRIVLSASLALAAASGRAALGDRQIIFDHPATGSLAVAHDGACAPLWASDGDWPGVVRAAHDLQADLGRVTDARPAFSSVPSACPAAIVVGTVGRSALIDDLVARGKIDVSALRGKWESFLIQVVDKPFDGVDRALVVAGSDKRGTIYGIYEISQQAGVSPWYWWADVPPRKSPSLYVPPVRWLEDSPSVKYRGIFLNDEAPALAGWAKEKFGGFNHEFYAKVFELILRLRGNYLWPAMWDNAFNEDDPENPRLADEYGVVMGTSHHEPMLRAQQEWKRHGKGPWNFAQNEQELEKFWAEGVRRNRDYESIVTIGMRGDGDMPMSEQDNIGLLERIVAAQRGILAREVNPDVAKIPQLWALYKEVQGYFEKGMRVPDDVTLLWCDDNWGNIRRLPTAAERGRSGGAGIYYHFDYVGGPRSYKWLNTYPISKVQEQLDLAWRFGDDRIWIVNVGDLKPMEFPIEFFLSFAWRPDRWTNDKLGEFGELWAAREFGPEHAKGIASLVDGYTRLNGIRKPEHVTPETFSITEHLEAEAIARQWEGLKEKGEEISRDLAPRYRDAFYQLVLHPVKACAVVADLNIAAARDRLYAVQGRATTNLWEQRARHYFGDDAALTRYWNTALAGGKWVHFMDQTHLGYTTWQEPVANAIPAITEIQIPAKATLGVSVEGSPNAWPTDNVSIPAPVLPELDAGAAPAQSAWIDVFSRGAATVEYRALPSVPWLHVTPDSGPVTYEERLAVTADWAQAPRGPATAAIDITSSSGDRVHILVHALNETSPVPVQELRGHVVINPVSAGRPVPSDGHSWVPLQDYGRWGDAVTSDRLLTQSFEKAGSGPSVTYPFRVYTGGDATVGVAVAPTLNFMPGHGLRFAVAVDGGAPMVDDYVADVGGGGVWAESVIDGIRWVRFPAKVALAPGRHDLKLWMIDPGVVVERLTVDFKAPDQTQLGPPDPLEASPSGR